jgi:GT2 family glycosyltransferase
MSASTSRPDVSVVLVNWNGLELTSAAIQSLLDGTRGVTYEVIVVDNGSKDGSVTALSARFPSVRMMANDANEGFGRAVNQGFTAATGRYLLTLNNDTRLLGDTVGESVRYMDAHADVGALGVLHYNADEARTVQPSAYNVPTPLAELLAVVGLRTLAPPDGFDPTREGNVGWLCGSYMLMRRECLDAVGLFDERFFAYDEDIDWCIRARRAGWAVRFWPGAALIHLGGGVAPHMRDKTFVHFRSRLTYLRKHHSAAVAATYYGGMVAAMSAGCLLQCARLMTGGARWTDVTSRWRRVAQFALLRPGRLGG